ncbi:5926_t:CDS:2 [Ambispora leptoticha]|uniref:Small nuclear ribonucleoprotein Sm D3 n=2 Tax=Glomeromycetes TaxID=214506 RepID=A0A9N8ZSZ4_9GLOM|nr:5926_t:CDS:2 [Ambispora leptoticha]CAG8732459.1 33911_t:CDS:2 [Racocetra persica]
MSIGVPIKLLHEAQGHIVTLELNNGTVYRGKLSEAEDNMNVQLREITVTARDVARAQARGGRGRGFRGGPRGRSGRP